MFEWLIDGPGKNFRQPKPGSPTYLGGFDREGRPKRPGQKSSQSDEDEDDEKSLAEKSGGDDAPPEYHIPFPQNPGYVSLPVLDESMREEIYKRVMVQKKTVKTVSAELSVDMNRVGAVVRLKGVEKQWIKEGKPLAKPYAKAVLGMLPKTSYDLEKDNPHESINDLPVHPATVRQIFHPTSESRSFTRTDAATVFNPGLLPADERIPHPELIELARERSAGLSRDERVQRQRERLRKDEEARIAAETKFREREEKTVKKILPDGLGGHGGRWEWRFRDIRVEDVGKDGRSSTGTGWRYGVPHEDRKRGQVKIPTEVRS